jgi:hypothetical protein
VHLIFRLRGGGPRLNANPSEEAQAAAVAGGKDAKSSEEPEMAMAAGGLIRQAIFRDEQGEHTWDANRTKIFNVQILNSVLFEKITGKSAAKPPMSAKEYAKLGGAFLSLGEQPGGIKGDFKSVKSVAQLDGKQDWIVKPSKVLTINQKGVWGNSGKAEGGSKVYVTEPPVPSKVVIHELEDVNNPVPAAFFNPAGPKGRFRSVWTMKREVAQRARMTLF